MPGIIQRWRAPEASFIKTNWDAALDEENKKMGIGIIIRDREGEILVTLSAHKKFQSKPMLAKCLALWKAMQLCRELDF